MIMFVKQCCIYTVVCTAEQAHRTLQFFHGINPNLRSLSLKKKKKQTERVFLLPHACCSLISCCHTSSFITQPPTNSTYCQRNPSLSVVAFLSIAFSDSSLPADSDTFPICSPADSNLYRTASVRVHSPPPRLRISFQT